MQTHLPHLAMLGLALILGGCGDDQQASARTGSAARTRPVTGQRLIVVNGISQE